MIQYVNELNRPNAPIKIIESVPKTGRTWLKLLIGKYLSLLFDIPDFYKYRSWNFFEHIYDEAHIDFIPAFIHSTDAWSIPVNRIRYNRDFIMNKEVMFLIRDPRDVIVSAYYYRKYGVDTTTYMTFSTTKFTGTIDEFVHFDMSSLKSCIRVYNIWLENSNILSKFDFMLYEDMIKDTRHELIRLIKFLDIELNEDFVSKAVGFCEFEKMKAYCKLSWGRNWSMAEGKVREAGAGTWKEEFKQESIDYINKYIKEKLNDFYYFYK